MPTTCTLLKCPMSSASFMLSTSLKWLSSSVTFAANSLPTAMPLLEPTGRPLAPEVSTASANQSWASVMLPGLPPELACMKTS